MFAGAAGSLAALLYAARSRMHTPATLQVIFVIWVSSPFVLLLAAQIRSSTWSPSRRARLNVVTVALALLSVAVYAAGAALAARPTPIFVITPPLSWLAITLVLLLPE